MAEKIHILLVEDDVNLGFVIQDNLEEKGYEVVLCKDGDEALRTFNNHSFDLCILDIMLPKKDGIALAENIREINIAVPIIFLTAKAMKEDKIAGFKVGGDDYLTKPFNIEELLLRIQVFLKRSNKQESQGHYHSIGHYKFDYSNRNLRIGEEQRHLTHKEAEVLRLLCENRNRVLDRNEILMQVWGDDDYFMGRSLDVFISKLRKYFKQDPAVSITNYHGIGFKLEE